MIKIAVAVIVASSLVATAIFYHKETYLLGLGLLLLLVNSIRRRLVFLIVSNVLKAFVPARKRLLVKRKIALVLKHIRVRARIMYNIYWKYARKRIRIATIVLLVLALKVFSIIIGHMLGIIAIIPIVGGVLLALGQLLLGSVWLKNFAIRLIAGMGLNKLFPHFWRFIPDNWRIYVDKTYKKLWTRYYARPLIKKRMNLITKFKKRRKV